MNLSRAFWVQKFIICVKRGLPVVLVVCVVLFSRFSWKKLQKKQKENHADLVRDSQKWFDMKIHLICIKTLSGWKGCTLYYCLLSPSNWINTQWSGEKWGLDQLFWGWLKEKWCAFHPPPKKSMRRSWLCMCVVIKAAQIQICVWCAQRNQHLQDSSSYFQPRLAGSIPASAMQSDHLLHSVLWKINW